MVNVREAPRSANLGLGHKRLGNLRFQADTLSASQTYQPGGEGMAAILSAVQTSHDGGDRDSNLSDRGLGQGIRLGFPERAGQTYRIWRFG